MLSFIQQNEVVTRLLPDTSSARNINDNNLNTISSCCFKYYFTDVIMENIQLNLKDNTAKKERI